VRSSRFVFPALDNKIDLEDKVIMKNQLSSKTTTANLKVLAKLINLKKHLTFHVSRHTFATTLLRKGVTIDKISKLMGHSQIRETQIYAKLSSEALDGAMNVLDE